MTPTKVNMPTEGDGEIFVDASNLQIARVAIKPPPFWKPDVRLWFQQVEAQFIRSNITTDETKFYTLVAEIDSSVLKHAADIIQKPPAGNKYNALKERLIKEFSESKEVRMKRLLSGNTIDGRKPTTFLRELRDLADGHLDEAVLKSLWLRQLPRNVQQILETVTGDLDSLAEKADNIMAVADDSTISAVSGDVGAVASLQGTIMELNKRLERLELGVPKPVIRATNRQRSYSPHARSRNVRSPSGELCWYHRRFGARATRCKSPCHFRPEAQEN